MMHATKTISVRWQGETCALYAGSQLLLHGPWQDFDEMARALWRVARGESKDEHSGDIRFTSDGVTEVVIIGKWSSACPTGGFNRLASAMHSAARAAEATNNQVLTKQAADGAILARAGLPFGLSDNPRVKDEIAKIAATDTTLRKAIPFPVVAAIPGVPRVRHISNVAALKLLHAQDQQMRKDLYGKATQ